jgi:hypothetical protein
MEPLSTARAFALEGPYYSFLKACYCRFIHSFVHKVIHEENLLYVMLVDRFRNEFYWFQSADNMQILRNLRNSFTHNLFRQDLTIKEKQRLKSALSFFLNCPDFQFARPPLLALWRICLGNET